MQGLLKGVVRSKITRGDEEDSLGEILLCTQTKSEKNWPRTGAKQHNTIQLTQIMILTEIGP